MKRTVIFIAALALALSLAACGDAAGEARQTVPATAGTNVTDVLAQAAATAAPEPAATPEPVAVIET